MQYIKRRFLASIGDAGKIVCEDEFFRMPGLKVILGEPGTGKTRIVGNLLKGGAVACPPRVLMAGFGRISFRQNQLVVVDGVDEVLAYQTDGQALLKILAGIPTNCLSQCVLTCRAADWNAVVSEQDLQVIGHKPHVGTLLPFDDDDVREFVDHYVDPLLANGFVSAAKEAGAFELLRNPQMLVMFLEASDNKNGFPASRKDLFEKAAEKLITEDNDLHRTLNKNLKGSEELLQAAEFVCAQLILGNQQGIDIEGPGGVGMAPVNELAGAEFSLSMIRTTLGTKLFRMSARRGVVEPCHRTVAEFLAARFISRRLFDSLSLRRVETLIYGPDFTVPAALRGMHAWVATIHPEVTRDFIQRDSFGFVEYGDPENISGGDVIFLVDCLEESIKEDPSFSAERLRQGAFRGIARVELKDWLWQIISEPQKGLALRLLVLRCVGSARLGDCMMSELTLLIFDRKVDIALRIEALEVMMTSGNDLEWGALHARLTCADEVGSLLLAHELVRKKASFFSGVDVVQTVYRYARVKQVEKMPVVAGEALAKKMSNKQLVEALDFITALSPKDREWKKMAQRVDKFRSQVMFEVVCRKISISPGILLSELEYEKLRFMFLDHKLSWLPKGFELDREIRREMQLYVLSNPDKWLTDSPAKYLARISPSLALTESDVKDLLVWACGPARDENSTRVWMDLVAYADSCDDFLGTARDLAIRQADDHPELKSLMGESIERQRRITANYKRLSTSLLNRTRKLEWNFNNTSNGLLGEDVRTCFNYAATYIGFQTPLDLLGAKDRVIALVGEYKIEHALNSFENVLTTNDIPDVRQVVQSRQNYARWWWQPVLIAYCVYVLDRRTLNLRWARSTLAVGYWELAAIMVPSTTDFFSRLRSAVLQDDIARSTFLCDFFEPFFEVHKDCIPRIDALADDDFFANVAGELAIQWLIKYSHNMRNETVVSLLKTVHRRVAHDEVVKFVKKRALDPSLLSCAQKDIWFGLLFGLDYEGNKDFFGCVVFGGHESLIAFRMGVTVLGPDVRLTIDQNVYIVETFASDLRGESVLSSRSFPDEKPELGYEFIHDRLEALADLTDPKIVDILDGFIREGIGPPRLQQSVKDLIMQNKRMRAELASGTITLGRVREVLLSRKPSNALQLQALVMDELCVCQRIVRSDPLNQHRFFWADDKPKLENDCRDLIAMMLESRLAKYGIRTSTENRMPNDNRSDILLMIGEINLSIEIKCQWHRDVWTAAAGQLQNYTAEYRADGYGIYLVVFFGAQSLQTRKLRASPSGRRAASGQELQELLSHEYSVSVPGKNCFFVFDVSSPKQKRE